MSKKTWEAIDGIWNSSGDFMGASAFLTLKAGNCDWTESLVKRPE